MEGDNTNINIDTTSKRERDNEEEEDVNEYIPAKNLYDRATKAHQEYREAQARWDIYKDTLKESGSRYILRVQKAIIKESDRTLSNILDDICEIDRLIGNEAGFYIAFKGGKRLLYGYASQRWKLKTGDAEATLGFRKNGEIGLRHPYMFGGVDDIALTTFFTSVHTHLPSLLALGDKVVEENRILLRDPMHYWTTTLIHAIRENFDPISQTYNGRDNE